MLLIRPRPNLTDELAPQHCNPVLLADLVTTERKIRVQTNKIPELNLQCIAMVAFDKDEHFHIYAISAYIFYSAYAFSGHLFETGE